jgi:hypothetical protein
VAPPETAPRNPESAFARYMGAVIGISGVLYSLTIFFARDAASSAPNARALLTYTTFVVGDGMHG